MKTTFKQCSNYSLYSIWLLATLLATTTLLAQSSFIIWKKGKEIGKLETYMRQTTKGYWYGLTLDMKTNIIASIQVNVQLLNFFDTGNTLLEASYSRSINDGSPKQHRIRFTKGGYELVSQGNQTQLFTGSVQFSTLQLYFQEPLQVTEVFSENHCRNIPLKCIGKGVYSLQQQDGYTTTFWFANGRLEKIEGDSMFGKVQFIRS